MDSTALALTLAGFGVVLIAIGYQRHHIHRDRSAVLHGVSGALLFVSGALLLALALNFNTYARLRPGEPLAELSIEKSGADSFRVRLLRIPAGDLQVFTLQGDRWEMQARLLQWHGWTTWFGLSSNIRLEQLYGINPAKSGKNDAEGYASSYSLSRNPGIHLWAWQTQHSKLLTALSTRLIKTGMLPLQNGLRYHLYFQENQLVARQINSPSPVAPAASPTSVAKPAFVNEFNRQTQNNSDTTDDTSSEVTSSSANSTGSSVSNSVLD
ncbi:MAG: hypothetical protein AB7F79_12335 [Steroidobacteraceae bacterium]